MKRYKPSSVLEIQEDPEGAFVLYSEAIEAMQAGLIFAMAHQEEIEAGAGDFGVLMPLVDTIRAGSATH